MTVPVVEVAEEFISWFNGIAWQWQLSCEFETEVEEYIEVRA
jgi:hypothetical protein